MRIYSETSYDRLSLTDLNDVDKYDTIYHVKLANGSVIHIISDKAAKEAGLFKDKEAQGKPDTYIRKDFTDEDESWSQHIFGF
ncbi:MAG: hypothetical protein LBL96_09740 [Clostridiales bacterium]|jgi:hypothetical protein|nr:hypothetical protein [Clostridiales bacterium]